MIDIVERLRHIDFTFWYAPVLPHEKFERIEIGKMSRDAANEIQQLREDKERLREALQDLLNATEGWVFQESYPLAVDKAKAALKEGG